MKLNNITVVPRHNRPTVQSKTDLELNFYNNGSYTDDYGNLNQPYHVIKSTDFSAGNFGGDVSSASGIYRTGEGQFAVVLVADASGVTPEASAVIANTATSAGQYFDLWVVQNTSTGAWTTYSNKFFLKNDVWITTTEPLTLTTTTQLKQKYIEFGSKIDLALETTFTSENRTVPVEIRNSFRESIIQNAALRITKLNETVGYDSRYQVSGFSDTSGLVRITSDDAILFNFDTNVLTTLAQNEGFGQPRGIYEVQAYYDVLNDRIYSKKFKVIVR
jgi:hypothetical protein